MRLAASVHAVLLFLAGTGVTSQAAGWVARYWPMQEGDWRSYTNAKYGAITQECTRGWAASAGREAFVVRESLQGSRSFYDYTGDGPQLVLLGGSLGSYGLELDPGLVALDEDSLVSGGTHTLRTTVRMMGTNAAMTVKITLNSAGTVKVPAGTYSNCVALTSEWSLASPGQTAKVLTAEDYVLAPGVGPIRLRLYSVTWNGVSSAQGWADLTDGVVGGKRVSGLAGQSGQIPPRILTGPQNRWATNDCPTTLSVTATGSNLDYRWMRDGIMLQDDGRLFGTRSNTLQFLPVTNSDAGTYCVRVANPTGTTFSTNSWLKVLPDTNRPSVVISSPKPAQRVSNVVCTVAGAATDNGRVAQVCWQLNGGAWSTNATTLNGWSNWAAAVELAIPGSNTVRVYSQDRSGNRSATNSVAFQYVVTKPLTLQVVGRGTVSGATNGQLLEVGTTYLLRAADGKGFAFTNWSDGQGRMLTNGRALSFTMQSNQFLVATFADVQPPSLAITYPAKGARVLTNNGLVVVRGTAGDDGWLTNVQFQWNDGPWTKATPAGNWSNWSATVAMRGGTNVVRAYAQDAAGRCSPTSSVPFQYVVTKPLTLQVVGRGTVSGATNGQPLEVGRNYTVTATASPGFAFTNWSDGQGRMLTNGRVLTFPMQSNLVLLAAFVDALAPTVEIASPKPGAKVGTNDGSVTAWGTAQDNVGVERVLWQLNGGAWHDASSTNGWTNWTAALTLTSSGLNTLKVYAQDARGYFSPTKSTSFTYLPASSHAGKYGADSRAALALRRAAKAGDGRVELTLDISGADEVRIEYSSNLVDWVPLTTARGSGAQVQVMDEGAASAPMRFYRAVAVRQSESPASAPAK
jgi:hypothetical protein